MAGTCSFCFEFLKILLPSSSVRWQTKWRTLVMQMKQVIVMRLWR
jgi:hypothetical protein